MSLVGVAPRRALPAMNSATVAMTLAPASRFARLRRKPTIDLILLDSRKVRGRSDAETAARRGRARPAKDKKPVTRRNEIARFRLTHYAPSACPFRPGRRVWLASISVWAATDDHAESPPTFAEMLPKTRGRITEVVMPNEGSFDRTITRRTALKAAAATGLALTTQGLLELLALPTHRLAEA